ncbi:acyltransferase family protein [Pseudochelatococcus lubricantis]|uniref:acyltransferase family protein n=1 Tax=Pseudochelatococcus lubricantis TaxID=1538102 RepID=UPI0035EB7EAF
MHGQLIARDGFAQPKAAERVSIQYLRAVAALMVAGVHLQPQLERLDHGGAWPQWLIGGVDIFFVISGFIMWLTTRGRPQTPLVFYRRRFRRIVPLYWLMTAFIVSVLLLAPDLLYSARLDPWHVLASFAFIPYPNPATGTMEPLLIPGWTLNYEMFFYLLFGAALLIPDRGRVIAVSVLLCAIVSLQALNPSPDTLLSFYTSSIILEFLLGIWIGVWHLRERRRPTVHLSLALLAGGFAAMSVLPTLWPELPRLIGFGLPAAVIVAAALRLEQAGGIPDWRGLRLLGDASYSLYLSHPLVLSAASRIWKQMGLPGIGAPAWTFVPAAMAACVAVAIALYLTVERPLATRRNLRRMPPPGRPAGAGDTGDEHSY